MPSISRPRLEFAAEAFLAKMRAARAARGRGAEVPRSLMEQSPEDRAILMAAIQAALNAADPKSDASFTEWMARRGAERPQA